MAAAAKLTIQLLMLLKTTVKAMKINHRSHLIFKDPSVPAPIELEMDHNRHIHLRFNAQPIPSVNA
jgi:hypothetical protein